MKDFRGPIQGSLGYKLLDIITNLKNHWGRNGKLRRFLFSFFGNRTFCINLYINVYCN